MQYQAFIQLFRGPQVRHRRAILSQLPIAPAVLTRNNTVVTAFESDVSTRAPSAVPLDETSPRVIEEESDSDDGIPDLMDDPHVPTDDHYLRFPEVQPMVSGIKATQDDDVEHQSQRIPTPIPQTLYMDADTMEIIPQAQLHPNYEDNSPAAREVRYQRTIARLEHLCSAIRGYNSSSISSAGNFANADFTKRQTTNTNTCSDGVTRYSRTRLLCFIAITIHNA